jgi:peptidyl-prolyl cis-trans isomerase D
MIGVMRKYRKTLQVGLLVVIAAFVVTSVVVFGAGTGSSPRDSVAVVDGEPIPIDRYERRYRAYYDHYAQTFKERFSPELAQQLQLPQQVIGDLVQEVLVFQRARREGLAVTDAELNAHMHAVPAFREGGRFSMKRYEAFLKGRGMSVAAFEEEARRQLTRQKMEMLVKSGIKVSDPELEQAFAHRREGVRAAWALVDPAPLAAAINPSDDELTKYLAEHAAEFRLPERRRVQYVAFNPVDFPPRVTPADVDKYYQDHAAEFQTPHQVRASHILVRVPETGGSEAEDKAKATAADAIRRAKAGEDFAKLAKELSHDRASAANGGDLGFVSKGEVVPQFEQALLKLGKGELSAEPVRTPFGYHVIKVTDVKEAGRKPREAVAAEIEARLALESSQREARAKAEEARAALQAAPDFMAAAKARGLNPLETTVTRSERPPAAGPGPSGSMDDVAFALAPGGVSAPVQTPAGWVVMKNVEALPAATPPLAEIRDRVVAAVRRQKAEAQALERAKELAKDARAGDFAEAAKKAGASTGESPAFTRQKPAEGLPGDAMAAALGTPVNGVTDPVRAPRGYYVLKVLERVPADMGGFAGEREQLSREVLTQKQTRAWESWLTELRSKARIETSPAPPVPAPARRG